MIKRDITCGTCVRIPKFKQPLRKGSHSIFRKELLSPPPGKVSPGRIIPAFFELVRCPIAPSSSFPLPIYRKFMETHLTAPSFPRC
jgi:hypothetical protein